MKNTIKLQPGMIFRNNDDTVVIVDQYHYKDVPGNRIIFHEPDLAEALVKYGWVLDEESVVDLILTKYES